MSLRGFHIIFITIATLLCTGLAVWVFKWSGMDAGVMRNMLGGGALLAAVLLLVYGILFYIKIHKLKI